MPARVRPRRYTSDTATVHFASLFNERFLLQLHSGTTIHCELLSYPSSCRFFATLRNTRADPHPSRAGSGQYTLTMKGPNRSIFLGKLTVSQDDHEACVKRGIV